MNVARRRALLCFIIAGVVGFLLLGGVLLRGCGFFPREVARLVSPDRRWEVVVTKRCAFLPNEFIDPAIVVRIRVRDVVSGHRWGEGSFDLEEDSDYEDPKVIWDDGRGCIVVSEFDDRDPTVMLRAPRPR